MAQPTLGIPARYLPHLDDCLGTLLRTSAADPRWRMYCAQMVTESDLPFVLLINRAFARSYALALVSPQAATTSSSTEEVEEVESEPLHVFSSIVPGEVFADTFHAERLVPGHTTIDDKESAMVVVDTLTHRLMTSSLELGYLFFFYRGDDCVGQGIVGLAVHIVDHDTETKKHKLVGDAERLRKRIDLFHELADKMIDEEVKANPSLDVGDGRQLKEKLPAEKAPETEANLPLKGADEV